MGQGKGKRERGKSSWIVSIVQVGPEEAFPAHSRRTFPLKKTKYRLNRGVLRPEFDGFDGAAGLQDAGTGLLANRSRTSASPVTRCMTHCPATGALGQHHYTRVFIASRSVLIDQQEAFRHQT